MKNIILVLFFTNSYLGFCQNICHNDILNGEKISKKNEVENFINNDFSVLWTKTENNFIYGIIGNDYQRIRIQFLSVIKNENNPTEYFIYGKSNVKENICELQGKIIILKIQETERTQFGVDDEFKNSRIKTQGLITAKYEFFENKNKNYTGIFSGELKSKWFLDKDNLIQYDNINSNSDAYFNNSFVGIWKMYGSETEKICNWADYRVPNINCNFDIGAGEFNVNQIYVKNGWLDIALKNRMPNKAIIENKSNKPTKNWWE
ncbi:hypothetical protein [Flavobacterium eburneipallidum]|uniref:hypothetical protein n=1 Tax=Flavobacterium eburneipallidum TaxID=3003263 RepID=UPI0022AC8CF6|nr:hypothetical protein [Flavobacterium eburneipallidum]